MAALQIPRVRKGVVGVHTSCLRTRAHCVIVAGRGARRAAASTFILPTIARRRGREKIALPRNPTY
eukprot:7142975-Pyramimonas_sp.AAC.1